jgi:hypothetical protein
MLICACFDPCRAVAEALLAALVQLQAGATFQPGVIPAQTAAALAPTSSSSSSTGNSMTATHSSVTATGGASATVGVLKVPAPGAATAPVTARSTATSAAATDFSLGSDVVSSSWHADGPVDVASLTKLVQIVLKVLQRMERWHCTMSIGEDCST